MKNSLLGWVLKLNVQAIIFGGNDQAIAPSFPYFLNKVSNPLLPYFHYFFLCFTIILAQYQLLELSY